MDACASMLARVGCVCVCVCALSVVYISPFTQLYQGNVTLQRVLFLNNMKFYASKWMFGLFGLAPLYTRERGQSDLFVKIVTGSCVMEKKKILFWKHITKGKL